MTESEKVWEEQNLLLKAWYDKSTEKSRCSKKCENKSYCFHFFSAESRCPEWVLNDVLKNLEGKK